jgi:hypothetical protein
VTRISDLLREVEWRKCANDIEYFLENYWYISHPEGGQTKFKLRDAQKHILKMWQTERYTISLKARQIGFSTLGTAFVFWNTYFHDNRPIVFLSRTEREAADLVIKVAYGVARLPEWMTRRGPTITGQNQLKITFNNGSSIEAMPSQKDPARGKSLWLVFVDEWAFLEDPEGAWASIEPVTDIGGRVVGVSTANGSGNFFHEFWVRATTGLSQFKAIFFPWDAVPERDDNWYKIKASQMKPWQLHQEYPRTAEEAFIKSGNPVFDVDYLASIGARQPTLVGQLQQISSTKDTQPVMSEGGPLRVWFMPEVRHSYVIGADTAEGGEHGDYSSAHVIDNQTGFTVAHWHGHIDPDRFGIILEELGYWYNTALVGPETNASGLTTAVRLRNDNYPNLYYRHTVDTRQNKTTQKLGWKTDKKSKPLMIDELWQSLRDEDLYIQCEHTLAELKTYVRDPDGSMHGSPYDDRVISLAIANQMRKFARTPTVARQQPDTWGTGVWWEQQIRKSHPEGAWIIGA